jgi:hypothetical protein
MRAVVDALDRLGMPYFVTGSVAASVHGVLRQSHDTDVVLIDVGRFNELAETLRERWEVPGLGQVWVASVEDLVLAKLVCSGGTSELQLRDCAQLLRPNGAALDRPYLERWAERLGVSRLLRDVES